MKAQKGHYHLLAYFICSPPPGRRSPSPDCCFPSPDRRLPPPDRRSPQPDCHLPLPDRRSPPPDLMFIPARPNAPPARPKCFPPPNFTVCPSQVLLKSSSGFEGPLVGGEQEDNKGSSLFNFHPDLKPRLINTLALAYSSHMFKEGVPYTTTTVCYWYTV